MEYWYMFITTIFISLVLFCYIFRNKNGLPTNWPLLGMLPAILVNINRIHEFCFEILEKSELTFHIKGPWFTNMHLLLTCDPSNFNHMLSKKFGNYVKGSKLIEVLEPLGDGIFNSNSTIWNYHRKLGISFFTHQFFQNCLVDITWEKVQNSLIPILEHASDRAIVIDLEDVLLRLMYDTMCVITMDHDPKSLSLDLPSFPVMKAVVQMANVVIYCHALPTCVWKFFRWLNVGEERKFKQASTILDKFIYDRIEWKREERKRESKSLDGENEVRFDLLTLLMNNENENLKISVGHNNDKFLRDTITNFFLAGGESTSIALSWFFYLLSRNQEVLHKIKEELNLYMMTMKDNSADWFPRNFKNIDNSLIYLHAAICESLRLYPSVAFNCKEPIETDILPSGHRVDPNMQIILNMYTMGRMKSIWGDDCNEFKPERWILENGTIKHEPSYKFSAFSSGPRTCIGRQMVFTQMKIVAAIVIQNYRIEVIRKDHVPSISLLLHMKDEFKVKVLRS